MKVHRLLLAALVLAFCSFRQGQSAPIYQTVQSADTVKPFVWPEIPKMYTTREQKLEYTSEHFWQHFNFADTAYVHHPEITEEAWSNYIFLLKALPPEMAASFMKTTLDKAAVNKTMYNYFASLADKYLYDPNSPMRNEDLYIVVLEHLLKGNRITAAEKIRMNYRLKLARRNRVGEKATDFTYTMADGKQSTLFKIPSTYTLIFFNNPGCHACAEYIQYLKTSSVIRKHIMDKTLTVLAVYPDDDLSEWIAHQKDIPSSWINSYDKGTILQNNTLYDLKAIPCLYLLDKNKIVLLKDVQADAVEAYLNGN